MLNVFTLSASINESINTAKAQPIVEEALPSYEFAGTIDEATQNLDYMVMIESLEAKQFSVGLDEIMVECAISHSENLDTLIEAANGSFIKKIGEAIQKAIGWTGGLIKKLGEWVTTMISKTKSYNKQIRKAIEKTPAGTHVSIEGYAHDFDKVKDITANVKSLIEKYVGEMNDAGNAMADASDKMAILDKLRASLEKNSSFNDDEIIKVSETLVDRIEKAKEDAEADPIYKEFQEIIKVSGEHENLKSVLLGLASMVRGEKTERKLNSNSEAISLLVAMENHSDAINGYIAVLKGYQKSLNDAQKVLKKCSKAEGQVFGGNIGTAYGMEYADSDNEIKAKDLIKMSMDCSRKIGQLYSLIYSRYVGIINQMTAIINGTQSTLRTLINESISADISLLNAYVRAGKSKKSDDKAEKVEMKVLPAGEDAE